MHRVLLVLLLCIAAASAATYTAAPLAVLTAPPDSPVCPLDAYRPDARHAGVLFRGANVAPALVRAGGVVVAAFARGYWLDGGTPALMLRLGDGAVRALPATDCVRAPVPGTTRVRSWRLAASGKALLLVAELLVPTDLVAGTAQHTAIGSWFAPDASSSVHTAWTSAAATLLADATDGERIVDLVAAPAGGGGSSSHFYLLTFVSRSGALLLRQTTDGGRTWNPLHTRVVRMGVTRAQTEHARLLFSRFSRDTLFVALADPRTGGAEFLFSTNSGRTWATRFTRATPLCPTTPNALVTLLDEAYQPERPQGRAAGALNKTAALRHGLGAARVIMAPEGALYAAVGGTHVTHSATDGMRWSVPVPVDTSGRPVVITGLAATSAGALAVAYERSDASTRAEWRVSTHVALFETVSDGGLARIGAGVALLAYDPRKQAQSEGAFGGDGVALLADGAHDFQLAFSRVTADASVLDAAVVPGADVRAATADDAARSELQLVRIACSDCGKKN